MERPIRRRRRRFNFRMLLLPLIVIVLTGIVLAVVLIPKSTEISFDIVFDGIDGHGLFVRDEASVELEAYEKVVFENLSEGDLVEKDDPVVSAYKKGYIKATIDKLAETEKNIVQYQNQNIISGFDDKNIKNFDFEIQVAIQQMSTATENYLELYNTLCHLMQDREAYIRQTYNTESNTYIQGLYADEKALLESIKAWQDQIIAQKSGFISFYFDNAEGALTCENVLNLEAETFKEYLEKKYDSNLCGFKIVSDGKWYLAVSVKDVSVFDLNTHYTVFIGGDNAGEIGCLEKIISDRKTKLLIFSFEENVEKYLDMRKADVFIGERIEGFSIDSKYVVNSAVVIKGENGKETVPVEVIYSDGKRTIIKETDALKIGQKVYK
ncbi:MAG: hypothetical protein IKB86_03110 [Clostridia bacterium]|nr:hypothetical protein [Clostridia bacterium]